MFSCERARILPWLVSFFFNIPVMLDAWDIAYKRLLKCILFLNGQLSDRKSSTSQSVVSVYSLKTKTALSLSMQMF